MQHVPQDLWLRLRRGELDARDLAPFLRHLGECAGCAAMARESVEGAEDVAAAWITGGELPNHLDWDSQLLPYAQGSLGPAEREIVESHLDDCVMCAREVADLRVSASDPLRPWHFLAIAAAVTAVFWTIGVAVDRSAPEPRAERMPAATASPAVPSAPRYPQAWQQLVDEALRTGKLPFPSSLESLRGREDPLRGSGGGREVELVPAGVVIDENRPLFAWAPREGASYVVSVFDGDTRVMRSPSLQTNEWLAERPLPRGKTYIWQIEVSRGGEKDVIPAPPAPPAMFRITTEEDSRALATARMQYAGDPLLRAVVAARAGLQSDAFAALRKVQSSDPRVEALKRAYAQSPYSTSTNGAQ